MDYFEVLIGREDVINPKPHPEPILKALHLMKANKENAFMVGDTCLDILSAKEAGIKAIGVKWEYDENLKKCAEIVKNNVLEAVKYIKEF
jgi:phosphoglycolate phosphatase